MLAIGLSLFISKTILYFPVCFTAKDVIRFSNSTPTFADYIGSLPMSTLFAWPMSPPKLGFSVRYIRNGALCSFQFRLLHILKGVRQPCGLTPKLFGKTALFAISRIYLLALFRGVQQPGLAMILSPSAGLTVMG